MEGQKAELARGKGSLREGLPRIPVFWGSCAHGVTGCAHFWHHIVTAHMKSWVIEKPPEKQSLGAYAGGHHTSPCSLHCSTRLPKERVFNRTFCLRKQMRENKPVFKKSENSLQIFVPRWWTGHLQTGLLRCQSCPLHQSFLNTLLSTRHHSKNVLRGIGEFDPWLRVLIAMAGPPG